MLFARVTGSLPIHEVEIVGPDSPWSGRAGYQRWLDLNGIDRHDSRLSALIISIRDGVTGNEPATTSFSLPRETYEELVGDVDFALEYPDLT